MGPLSAWLDRNQQPDTHRPLIPLTVLGYYRGCAVHVSSFVREAQTVELLMLQSQFRDFYRSFLKSSGIYVKDVLEVCVYSQSRPDRGVVHADVYLENSFNLQDKFDWLLHRDREDLDWTHVSGLRSRLV